MALQTLPAQGREPSLAFMLSVLAAVSVAVGLASTLALHAMGAGIPAPDDARARPAAYAPVETSQASAHEFADALTPLERVGGDATARVF